MNGTLEQMLEQLEMHGWECKLRSRQGRGFIASVWKPDVLGGGSKLSAATPTEALTLALQDAMRRRRNRWMRLKRQQRGVGLEVRESTQAAPLPRGAQVEYEGKHGNTVGMVMNYEWNESCTAVIGYYVARPGDEDYPDCWECKGLSTVALATGGEG